MPHEEAENHCSSITRKTTPCTSHVAKFRDEDDIDGNEHGTPCQGEPRTPDGLVDELIPEREVEVDAHHDFSSHHNRHGDEPFAIFCTDDVLENVHIAHHAEESEEGEDDEVFHRHGIVFLAVLVLCLRKDDGFVGIAECLGNHCHNHCHLHTGTILAQLHFRLSHRVQPRVGVCPREDDLVNRLVEHPRNGKHKNRP